MWGEGGRGGGASPLRAASCLHREEGGRRTRGCATSDRAQAPLPAALRPNSALVVCPCKPPVRAEKRFDAVAPVSRGRHLFARALRLVSTSTTSAASAMSGAASAASASSASASAGASSRRYWLFKSEPDTHVLRGTDGKPVDVSYPFSRLAREGVGPFFGVRNFQARNFLRDQVKKGDRVFFYHSSCAEPGIAGVAEIEREAYPDPDASTPGHPYFDEKHSADSPRWFRVDLRAVRAMGSGDGAAAASAAAAAAAAAGAGASSDAVLPLTSLKSDAALLASEMVLLRQPRLSVQPVTEAQWKRVLEIEAERASGAGAGAGAGGGGGKKKKVKADVGEPAAAGAGAGEAGAGAGAKAGKRRATKEAERAEEAEVAAAPAGGGKTGKMGGGAGAGGGGAGAK